MSSGNEILYGLDIETECAVEGCTDNECRHALDPHRNRITVMAVSNGLFDEHVFRGPNLLKDFTNWLGQNPKARFTAHYGKFDFRVLITKLGSRELLNHWEHDSNLLAYTDQWNKIPDEWLAAYNEKRKELNKRRGEGLTKHREASKHSLKTLAPFILGVEAFWEPESGHDDDEYVLKDARYALGLTEYYLKKLPAEAISFYRTHYFEWNKMLVEMELDGIAIDLEQMRSMWQKSEAELVDSESTLQRLWAPHFEAYEEMQRWEIEEKYHARTLVRQMSVKQQARHEINKEKALAKVEPFNLGSPSQLMWLFNERLGLRTESTDVETLYQMQDADPGIKEMLRQRGLTKLCSSYYPSYQQHQWNGRIHTHFNSSTARTGRLSSSDPNLQQVPAELHPLFIADVGELLVTRDLSTIEPTMLGYYSEDETLCTLLINGDDFHGTTAVAAFDLECHPNQVKRLYPLYRAVAKTVGLAVLYGAGANRVLTTLHEEGFTDFRLSDAKRIVEKIRNKYAGVWEFKKQLDYELEQGAVMYNYMGRPFRIENSDDVYMKGLNTLIQGSASDLMQEIALITRRSGKGKLRLLVHDELVAAAPEQNALDLDKFIDDVARTSFKLDTAYGRIPIRTEGKVARVWEK